MFDWPISSPQMMTMFGFFAAWAAPVFVVTRPVVASVIGAAVRPVRAAPGGCRRTGWAGSGDGSLRSRGRHGVPRGDSPCRGDISQARAEPEDDQCSENPLVHDLVAPDE